MEAFWKEKITKAVDKILNMKMDETIRFSTFVVKKLPAPGGCKWMIISSNNENICKGVLYADCYDNDTQFTNDLIGLIF